MVKTLLLLSIIVFYQHVSAQKNLSNQRKVYTEDSQQNRLAIGSQSSKKLQASPGTYQLILKDANHQFAVNDSFLEWLEVTRKENEDQYIDIDATIILFLPSRKTINKADFNFLNEVKIIAN